MSKTASAVLLQRRAMVIGALVRSSLGVIGSYLSHSVRVCVYTYIYTHTDIDTYIYICMQFITA